MQLDREIYLKGANVAKSSNFSLPYFFLIYEEGKLIAFTW